MKLGKGRWLVGPPPAALAGARRASGRAPPIAEAAPRRRGCRAAAGDPLALQSTAPLTQQGGEAGTARAAAPGWPGRAAPCRGPPLQRAGVDRGNGLVGNYLRGRAIKRPAGGQTTTTLHQHKPAGAELSPAPVSKSSRTRQPSRSSMCACRQGIRSAVAHGATFNTGVHCVWRVTHPQPGPAARGLSRHRKSLQGAGRFCRGCAGCPRLASPPVPPPGCSAGRQSWRPS